MPITGGYAILTEAGVLVQSRPREEEAPYQRCRFSRTNGNTAAARACEYVDVEISAASTSNVPVSEKQQESPSGTMRRVHVSM
jgi:hypothetical protein